MEKLVIVTPTEGPNVDLLKAVQIQLTLKAAEAAVAKVEWDNLLEECICGKITHIMLVSELA